MSLSKPSSSPREAIAWREGATVGDIALKSLKLEGDLERGIVACRLTEAGKFRNGAKRWWCEAHQEYWGVLADAARDDGRCKRASDPMIVAVDPERVDLSESPDLILRLSMAEGLIRASWGAREIVAPALALKAAGLFKRPEIQWLAVTPPALLAMKTANGCSDCARCGYPHLDLGSFAQRDHRRHTCGHCGHDATHSERAMVSNPLWALGDRAIFSV